MVYCTKWFTSKVNLRQLKNWNLSNSSRNSTMRWRNRWEEHRIRCCKFPERRWHRLHLNLISFKYNCVTFVIVRESVINSKCVSTFPQIQWRTKIQKIAMTFRRRSTKGFSSFQPTLFLLWFDWEWKWNRLTLLLNWSKTKIPNSWPEPKRGKVSA